MLLGKRARTKDIWRRTGRGRVLREVREVYGREDVVCGVRGCTTCVSLYAAQSRPSLGGTSSSLEPVLPPSNVYLVLDTNVLLHNLDLVESPSFGANLIVPQTVLAELRHRSLPLFNRVRALSNRLWVFSNEAHQDTLIDPLPSESPNDHNDRAIRAVAKWYSIHLGGSVSIVLLTDDAQNRILAQQQGITAYSVRKYVESLPKDVSSGLLDLVASSNDNSDDINKSSSTVAKKTILFSQHLPLAQLNAGVRNGILHQGYYNPNPYNFLEATVNSSTLTKPILIVGRENMNRSVSGDVVAVKLLPESDWRAPSDQVLEQDTANKNQDPDDDEDEEGADSSVQSNNQITSTSNSSDRQPTGIVVGIIKRNWRPYVCHLDRASLSPTALDSITAQNVLAIPVDPKIPKIRIRTRQASNLVDCKFLVSIDQWDATARSPEGHFVRLLGKVQSKEAEIEGLLLEYDVPYRPFSQAVLDCLPSEGEQWVVPPKQDSIWNGREDFRSYDICSIDPPGCQDIDDALHAKQLANGNIEAGVHIADVSYFVHPDTPMDAEAASRGTTVYLVDKRIDMLPPLLGTNLCSLRPYVERLAFSVIWELTPSADIVNVRFTKSVIASKAAFTYQEAQTRKDDKALNDSITSGIRLLNTIALALKAKRNEAGALNLASPEIKIHLDSSETTGPIDVEQKQLLETNSLVEEFMFLANISVASKINEAFPQTAVLRRHGQPPSTNFDVLKDILEKRKGINLDISSSGALAQSLDECVDLNMPTFNTLVRIMATRCMLSAEYFCAGSVSRDSFGHYGLATPIYTHFTSPIRRYADVMVHRQLHAAIDHTKSLHATHQSKAFVDHVVENINKRHRLAQQAGRASVGFYVALSVRNREEMEKGEQVIEDAFVIRAFKNGLAVFVSRLGLESVLSFKQQETTFDAESYKITIPKKKKNKNGVEEEEKVEIGVFDTVRVQITVVQDKHTQRGKVQMYMVEPVDCRPSSSSGGSA